MFYFLLKNNIEVLESCRGYIKGRSMSHRKFEHPRHGSLGFLPRKRASRHRGKGFLCFLTLIFLHFMVNDDTNTLEILYFYILNNVSLLAMI